MFSDGGSTPPASTNQAFQEVRRSPQRLEQRGLFLFGMSGMRGRTQTGASCAPNGERSGACAPLFPRGGDLRGTGTPPGNLSAVPCPGGGRCGSIQTGRRGEVPARRSAEPLDSILSLQHFAFQTIRPGVSRKKRGFSAHFGPGGAVLPPRNLPLAKARWTRAC